MQNNEQEISFYKLFNPLTTKKSVLFLIILGIVVYFNSLFNGFVGDDKPFIIDNPIVHSVVNIPSQFLQGSFYDESGQGNNYYRPLFSTVVTFTYSIAGTNPFAYHFIQLVLHITNTILILLIFTSFFKRETAFILSLLFLVSPINTESVVYISSMQEALFLFFGLTGLHITMRRYSKSLDLVVPFFVLLSLLSKETGIVFLFLIPAYNYLYNREKTVQSIVQNILILFLYLFLRLLVAHIGFGNQVEIAPIQSVPLLLRLVSIPKILYFYISTFFYPKDLLMFQTWVVRNATIRDFYFPFILDIFFFLFISLTGLFIHMKKTVQFRHFAFFSVWFLVSISLFIQIISLDQTVADRWFYLPMIGLLGIIGILVTNIIDYLKGQTVKKVLMVVLITSICALSVRSMIRTTNWRDEQTLASHDIQLNNDSYQLQTSMGSSMYANGNFHSAELYYLRATKLFPSHLTYMNLGNIYLLTNNPQKAVTAFETALKYKNDNAFSWVYTGMAKYNSGDKIGGIKDVEKAYSMLPNDSILTVLTTMKNGEPITIAK